MLFNLLTEASGSSSGSAGGNGWATWVMLGVLAVILIAFSIYNRRSQKKRQEETANMLSAVKPGNKVKTIGGICGIVVEVCDEDNTFVLETGSETSGKSYMRFDKQAIYQTDAVAEKKEEIREDKKEEVKEDKKEDPKTEE